MRTRRLGITLLLLAIVSVSCKEGKKEKTDGAEAASETQEAVQETGISLVPLTGSPAYEDAVLA